LGEDQTLVPPAANWGNERANILFKPRKKERSLREKREVSSSERGEVRTLAELKKRKNYTAKEEKKRGNSGERKDSNLKSKKVSP